MSDMTITRICVGAWPFAWFLVSWVMVRDDRRTFPSLALEYFEPAIFGMICSAMLMFLVRVFIWIVFEGGNP